MRLVQLIEFKGKSSRWGGVTFSARLFEEDSIRPGGAKYDEIVVSGGQSTPGFGMTIETACTMRDALNELIQVAVATGRHDPERVAADARSDVQEGK